MLAGPGPRPGPEPATEFVVIVKASNPPNVTKMYTVKNGEELNAALTKDDSGVENADLPEDLPIIIEEVVKAIAQTAALRSVGGKRRTKRKGGNKRRTKSKRSKSTRRR